MKKIIALLAAATLVTPALANDFGQTGSVIQVDAMHMVNSNAPLVHSIYPHVPLFVSSHGVVVVHPIHLLLLAQILVGPVAPLPTLIMQENVGFNPN